MEDVVSIDVARERTPDGKVRELLHLNFSPENPGQALVDEFKKGL